jgi:hypothetical protein
MEAIFSRANRMMEIHHASQYTVRESWCIWCIKIRGFALFKNENKKKKNGWESGQEYAQPNALFNKGADCD